MSENQGRAPQFTELEKKMLVDGGWQCSFCKSVYGKSIENCDFCGHSRQDSDLHRLGLYAEVNGASAEAPAQAAIPEPAVVPEMVSSPEAAVAPEPVAPQPAVEPEMVQAPEMTAAPQTGQPQPSSQNKFIYADTDLGEQEQEIIDDGGWQCGFCRRINAYIVTSCACGHNRDDSDLKHLGKYVDPEEDYAYEDYDEDEYEEEYDEEAYEANEEPQVIPQPAPVPQMESPFVDFSEKTFVSNTENTAAAPGAIAQPVPQPQPVAPGAIVQSVPQPQPVAPGAIAQSVPQPQPVAPGAIAQSVPQPQPVAPGAIAQPAPQPQSATPGAIAQSVPQPQPQPVAPGAMPQSVPQPQPVAPGAIPQSVPQPQSVAQATPQPVPQVVSQPVAQVVAPEAIAQPAPQQPAPASQPSSEETPQDEVARKENLERQIMEDLRKNNFSDVAIVRANRKYKEMVKRGIMTQEEFNQKIHELLPVEEEDNPEEGGNPEPEAGNE